jgi:hypothetical protein
MLKTPIDVLQQFPVRKTKAQKQAFRDAITDYASMSGYPVFVESGKKGCQNLVIGDPAPAKYLVTAHYDTPARMPVANRLYADNPVMYILWQFVIALRSMLLPVLSGAVCAVIACFADLQVHPDADPNRLLGLAALVFLGVFLSLYALSYLLLLVGPANPSNANDNTSGVVTLLEILQSLPENQRHKVCFVLFDRNERGLQGSAAYRKLHRNETDGQLVLNLSCVGDGDHIFLHPTAKLKKDTAAIAPIYKCCGYFGKKSILVMEKNTAIYPSDHKNFPYALGISAYHKGKSGHYIDRIHTPRDTNLDITNINLLRAAIISLICRDAAQ